MAKKVDYESEIKALANKVLANFDELTTEFTTKTADLVKIGYKEDKAQAIAFKQIKGSFKAAIRSSAKPMEGYFIGVSQKRDQNKALIEGCLEKKAEYKAKYGTDKWRDVAINEKFIDENDNFLFTEDNMNGRENLRWRVGIVIRPDDNQKVAYGFFRPANTEEPLKFGTMYIRDIFDKDGKKASSVDGFDVDLLQWYQFRAGCKDPSVDKLTLSSTTQTKPVAMSGKKETYESTLVLMKEQLKKNLLTFEEIYFDGRAVLPDGLTPRIAICNCSIAHINMTNLPIDYIDLTDLLSEYEENVSMAIDKRMDKNLWEGAIGLAIFQPFWSSGKNMADGSLFGFIPDERLGGRPEPEEINDEEAKWE